MQFKPETEILMLVQKTLKKKCQNTGGQRPEIPRRYEAHYVILTLEINIYECLRYKTYIGYLIFM